MIMLEIIKILIGIAVLLIGIPLGSWLAHLTKDELKSGQKWFRLIIILAGIGAVVGLVLKNDVLLFSFLFIVVVTSRSLRRKP